MSRGGVIEVKVVLRAACKDDVCLILELTAVFFLFQKYLPGPT